MKPIIINSYYMKTLFTILTALFVSVVAFGNELTPKEQIINYIENHYGPVLEYFQSHEGMQVITQNYQISIQGSYIESVWDLTAQKEVEVPINERNIETALSSYYTYNMYSDSQGLYISLTRYDGIHENSFYFDEYYIGKDGSVTYYNDTDTLTVKNNEVIYQEVHYKLLY